MRCKTLSFCILVAILLAGPALAAPDAAPADAAATIAVTDSKVVLADGVKQHAKEDKAALAAASVAPAGDKKPKSKVVIPTEPSAILAMIGTAFKEGQWAWAIGLLFTLLIVLLRAVPSIKSILPKKVVPWLTIALATGASVATSLALGMNWLGAIGSGLTAGLAAIGGWEAFLKIFKKNEEQPAKSDESEEDVTEPPA